MIYRRAVLADLERPEFMPMMHRVLTLQQHGMVVDEAKVRATVKHTITEGYCALAEKDGVLVAYIAALITEHPYYERQQMCIIGWYSESPGAGFRLFQMAMDWRDEHPMIGPAYLYVDPDPRLDRIMKRRCAIPAPAYFIP